MHILILGNKGMLGTAIWKYFKRNHREYLLETTEERWPDNKFFEDIDNFNGDYIINCIGAIPQKAGKYEINYKLPVWLDKNVNCRIIHPGTDCEMDDDDYGISKKKATDYMIRHGSKTKILKTSIIGHEKTNNFSLLDWFLNSESEVSGFSRVYWNGNTTLEWAKQCYNLMMKWNKYKIVTVLFTECLSKYELLKIIKKVYNKNIIINAKSDIVSNKCLKGDIKGPLIEQQLEDLKLFYNK